MPIQEKIKKYREIRKRVFNEATRPTQDSEMVHNENKNLLKNTILDVCSKANLDNFRGNDEETIKLLWSLMWSKIFYSNRKAGVMTPFINNLKDYFDNHINFIDPGWDSEKSDLFKDYMSNSGIFKNRKTYKDRKRITKIVNIARQLYHHIQERPDDVFSFVTGNKEDVWEIHKHLLRIGFRRDLTALHFMMDIGFPVMKPDIVISSLFLSLGWLHEIIPNLPKDLTPHDLRGKSHSREKSKYGSKYVYTNPKMYKPIIDLARKLAENVTETDLRADIRWVSTNPLREFDFFMVKFGQKPEPKMGVVRQLFSLTDKSNNTCSTSCPF